jgi:hypothetical protein
VLGGGRAMSWVGRSDDKPLSDTKGSVNRLKLAPSHHAGLLGRRTRWRDEGGWAMSVERGVEIGLI